MERLFRALRPVIAAAVRHPAIVVLLALVLAAFGGRYAVRLTIDSDFAHLIPSSYASVGALERLRANVGGESDLAVAIQSPSFEANRRFADTLVARAMRLQDPKRGGPYFTRVAYKRDTAFLERNALYLATGPELDSLEHFLRAQIEAARLKANPFYFDLGSDLDAEPDSSAALTSTAASAGEALQASYRSLVGKEYPISDDSTVLALRFYSASTGTDLAFIDRVYRDLQAEVDSLRPATLSAGDAGDARRAAHSAEVRTRRHPQRRHALLRRGRGARAARRGGALRVPELPGARGPGVASEAAARRSRAGAGARRRRGAPAGREPAVDVRDGLRRLWAPQPDDDHPRARALRDGRGLRHPLLRPLRRGARARRRARRGRRHVVHDDRRRHHDNRAHDGGGVLPLHDRRLQGLLGVRLYRGLGHSVCARRDDLRAAGPPRALRAPAVAQDRGAPRTHRRA